MPSSGNQEVGYLSDTTLKVAAIEFDSPHCFIDPPELRDGELTRNEPNGHRRGFE
jgi:hypothetical protein